MAFTAEKEKQAGEHDLVEQDDGLDHLRADVTGTMAGANPNDPNYLGKIDSSLTALGHIDRLGSESRPEVSQSTMAPPTMSAAPAAAPTPSSATGRPTLDDALMSGAPPAMGAPKKPGVLGRIGHGLARMGNIAGDILAPGLMAITPGTDLYRRIQEQGREERSERERGLAVRETTAAAEKSRADTEARKEKFAESRPDAEEWSNIPTLQGPNGEPVEYEKTSGRYRFGNLAGTKQAKTPGQTQEQNKLAFQAVVDKLDRAGLPTDPKNLDKSLDKALARKVITPDEHGDARGYQAANPTPGTNLTVKIAGQENAQAMKDARTHYLYSDGPNGPVHMVTGDKVPPGVDAVPVKDPQTFISEAQNANIVQKSFSKLAQDDLSIFDSPAARAVLATALSETEARSMGILVAGTGGSISMPAGSGKIIDQFLENNAVPSQLRGAVKTYIADYWAIKDKMLMVQMAMQNGKMGRGNKAYFDAMVAQIPGPGTADSTMAKRQIADFNETLSGLKGRYPDSFGNYRKEPDLGGSGGGGGDQGVQIHNGYEYKKGKDGQWHRGKRVQ